MVDNETKLAVRDTESIINASKGERVVIIVKGSDIRIDEGRSNASNGILVEDQDRAVYEMEANGSLYAYNEGSSTATIEVSK